MAQRQRPGFLTVIWNNFWKTFTAKVDRTVVGKDHFGNVYYTEKSSDEERLKKVHRGYIPGSSKTWQDLPTEWEAWLRGRRNEVPTQEEIDRNLEEMMNVKRKAAELDEKYRLEKLSIQSEEEKLFQRKEDRLKQAKIPEIKSDYTDSSKEGEKPPFPKYKDFEDTPGQKYDPIEETPKKHNN